MLVFLIRDNLFSYRTISTAFFWQHQIFLMFDVEKEKFFEYLYASFMLLFIEKVAALTERKVSEKY